MAPTTDFESPLFEIASATSFGSGVEADMGPKLRYLQLNRFAASAEARRGTNLS